MGQLGRGLELSKAEVLENYISKKEGPEALAGVRGFVGLPNLEFVPLDVHGEQNRFESLPTYLPKKSGPHPLFIHTGRDVSLFIVQLYHNRVRKESALWASPERNQRRTAVS